MIVRCNLECFVNNSAFSQFSPEMINKSWSTKLKSWRSLKNESVRNFYFSTFYGISMFNAEMKIKMSCQYETVLFISCTCGFWKSNFHTSWVFLFFWRGGGGIVSVYLYVHDHFVFSLDHQITIWWLGLKGNGVFIVVIIWGWWIYIQVSGLIS